MCSFWKTWIRISDPRLLRKWCIKRTYKSFPRVDSSDPLMHPLLSDPGSLILIQIDIIPKERTLGRCYTVQFFVQLVTQRIAENRLKSLQRVEPSST